MWSRSKFQPSIENGPVKSFWGSKFSAPNPEVPERESNSEPISFWSKYRYAKSTKSSTTTSTTTTTTSTTTTTLPQTTAEETTTATSKKETTTWFDELNDETCGKCESRFCTAVNNFAQFSDHLLDGDHVIDVKFPSGWGIDSDWFLELYLSGTLDPLGVKGGIANAFVLDSSESQIAIRVCLGEEYENDKTGKIFMKLSAGIPWIDETLLCNCREKETTTAFEMMPTSTTTEAWFRTRQPKKIFSTTKKMTAKQTTLPIESRTAEKTTAEENWLEPTTSFQQTSAEKTTSSKQQRTTLPPTSTSAFLTQESMLEMKTTLFDSTTWTTSSAYFLPTEAATTMFSRTKKDLEWYKKYSKWRHFLN